MDKPYDFKDLADKLKGHGLEIAEEAARIIVNETFAWFVESAKLSATPIDDFALFAVPKLKELALSAVDQIDGKADAPADPAAG